MLIRNNTASTTAPEASRRQPPATASTRKARAFRPHLVILSEMEATEGPALSLSKGVSPGRQAERARSFAALGMTIRKAGADAAGRDT